MVKILEIILTTKEKIHCEYFWDDGKTFSAYSDKKKYIDEANNKLKVENY